MPNQSMWTTAQDDRLVYEVEVLGKNPARTSFNTTKTSSQIRDRVRKLRKQGRIKRMFPYGVRSEYELYSEEEILIIRRNTVDVQDESKRLGGNGLAKLLPGRTASGIASFIYKKGWGEPERSKAARSARKIGPGEEAKIVKFLRGPGRYWPPSRLSDKFGISKKAARRLRKKHRLTFTHKQAVKNSPAYLRWYKETLRRNAQASVNKSNNMLEKRRKKMDGLMESMIGKNVVWSECRGCGDMRPKTAEFFRTRKRPNSNRLYITNCCISCSPDSKLAI